MQEQIQPPSTNFNPSLGSQGIKNSILEESSNGTHSNNNTNRNVGGTERITSVAAGSALLLLGLSKRNMPGWLMAAAGSALAFRGTTGHCTLYQSLGINTSNGKSAKKSSGEEGIEVFQSFSVNATPEKLYSFWRKLEQLPQVLTHIESIKEIDSTRSHWVVKPIESMDITVEWDAEITRDEPNKLIAWKSLPPSEIDTSGEITFTESPVGRGTVVKVSMQYRPPGGQLTHMLAKVFGKSPSALIHEDLRNFKRLMEVGEIPSIKGQSQGSCAGKSLQ